MPRVQDTAAGADRPSTLPGPTGWLVTGAAGFIGSHLVARLLGDGHQVTGLDDFSTGSHENLADVERTVGPEAWSRFRLVEGDLRDPAACADGIDGVDVVLHQAAVNSVPRSVLQPDLVTQVNVLGTVRLLEAARQAGVARVVCASSSSVYGDAPGSVRTETSTGRPLSPYAASKQALEAYAAAYAKVTGVPTVCLRYFNVFGSRQNPAGPYSAVIPRWVSATLRGEPVHINGDGASVRDFTHVDNVVEANLRAAQADVDFAAVNVGCGRPTSLVELAAAIRLAAGGTDAPDPVFGPPRPHDVVASVADLTHASTVLGYRPVRDLPTGLAATVPWFTAATLV
ncbi:NAD-dependent epimerase/dehydratase family protein [Cellulomonas biazotea]|uniref:Capsular polysaccharide biosynthesis protein n=1 Tax=Cellulomonas biazotea TaxID=1709 RepID=A0A402DTS5_9CELL|nr:NAD-dependent epimerase/dehydratase family protein [Cellulomonas biazotea]GCE77466.1 capsular polysaccharide biosynthesis protein [Cellulomonas biazotea]